MFGLREERRRVKESRVELTENKLILGQLLFMGISKSKITSMRKVCNWKQLHNRNLQLIISSSISLFTIPFERDKK